MGGGADVGDLVGGLVLGVVVDGGEVALEDHDEVAGEVVFDEFGAVTGGGDFLVKGGGGCDDGALGVVSEAVVCVESGFGATDVFCGFGDAFEEGPELIAAVFFGEGVRAGRGAGCLFDGSDFGNEEGEAGEGGGGFAGGREGAGVLGAEGGGADEGLIDLVIFVVHGWCSVWIVAAEWIF